MGVAGKTFQQYSIPARRASLASRIYVGEEEMRGCG